MNNQPFGTGAHHSKKDYRTITHKGDMAAPIPLVGGYSYLDHENQHYVGICTGISRIQEVEKALGKKYSPDFQYLLQKKYLDGNWDEGSSIFNALKVGKTYGFLPAELWTYTTEADRSLPYAQYVAKLQAIPDNEIQRLIGLCENKLAGYAQIDISTKESIAQAILSSKAGIICRYEVGNEWWIPSWNPADIDPLKAPVVSVGGHAIIMSAYDYTTSALQTLANTWGNDWDCAGNGHINFDNYKMTEAWIPYYDNAPVLPPLPVHHPLTQNLYFGMINNDDVKRLQHVLGVKPETGNFGFITLAAVKAYQKANNIPATGFVGPLTRNSLNAKYF